MPSRKWWPTAAVAAFSVTLLTLGAEIFFRYSDFTAAKAVAVLLCVGGTFCLGWPGPSDNSKLPALAAFLLFLAYLPLAAMRFPGLTKEPSGVTAQEVLRWSGLIGGAVLLGALLFRAGVLGFQAILRTQNGEPR